ncbi:MAG TPA: thioredoxin family protein [Phycisphaerae bacterium]|nr:thioredoxin family protein [Phycisphaerae bacterium]HNU45326.1 thioredoxin family protein [Phycisphaerae bacterium]
MAKRITTYAVLALSVCLVGASGAYAGPGCSSPCGSKGEAVKDAPCDTQAEVGKPAPDFALKDLDGQEHKLSDLKGKIVVLAWTNHECPYVVRHENKAKTMQSTAQKFADNGVVWLAVNSSFFAEQKAEQLRKWTKDNAINYPVLLDAEGKVGRMYQAKTTPHMFVIDRTGVLVYAGAIDDDPQGRKESPRNYVEEAVRALLNNSTVAVASTKPYGCSVKYKG